MKKVTVGQGFLNLTSVHQETLSPTTSPAEAPRHPQSRSFCEALVLSTRMIFVFPKYKVMAQNEMCSLTSCASAFTPPGHHRHSITSTTTVQ